MPFSLFLKYEIIYTSHYIILQIVVVSQFGNISIYLSIYLTDVCNYLISVSLPPRP